MYSFNKFFLYAKKKLGRKVVNGWELNYKKKEWRELASKLIIEYYDPLYDHKKQQKKNKVLEYYYLKNLKNTSISKVCSYLQNKYSKNKI